MSFPPLSIVESIISTYDEKRVSMTWFIQIQSTLLNLCQNKNRNPQAIDLKGAIHKLMKKLSQELKEGEWISCYIVILLHTSEHFNFVPYWPSLNLLCPSSADWKCICKLVEHSLSQSTTSWISSKFLINMTKSQQICQTYVLKLLSTTQAEDSIRAVIHSNADFLNTCYLIDLVRVVLPKDQFSTLLPGNSNLINEKSGPWTILTYLGSLNLMFKDLYQLSTSSITSGRTQICADLELCLLQLLDKEIIVIWKMDRGTTSLQPLIISMHNLKSHSLVGKIVSLLFWNTSTDEENYDFYSLRSFDSSVCLKEFYFEFELHNQDMIPFVQAYFQDVANDNLGKALPEASTPKKRSSLPSSTEYQVSKKSRMDAEVVDSTTLRNRVDEENTTRNNFRNILEPNYDGLPLSPFSSDSQPNISRKIGKTLVLPMARVVRIEPETDSTVVDSQSSDILSEIYQDTPNSSIGCPAEFDVPDNRDAMNLIKEGIDLFVSNLLIGVQNKIRSKQEEIIHLLEAQNALNQNRN